MTGSADDTGTAGHSSGLGSARARIALAKRDVTRSLRSPFASGERSTIVHCAHHKAGTVWMTSVLTDVARHHGLRVYHSGGSPAPPEADIVLFPNTVLFDRKVFASRRIRGSHMVRDPRDLVVSAYFYHLRTDEAWVHAPREDLNGQSYQQYLQAASKHEGLMAEIRRLSRGGFPAMAAWDYDQPDFHEMRYEDLLADEPAEFRALFDSYGFTPAAAERATARAVALSAASRASGASGHMRSGRPGEWHEHLDADHLAAIDAAAGELIRRLGYPA